MGATKSPHKPRGTPPKPTPGKTAVLGAAVKEFEERRLPADNIAAPAPEPPGQLGVISLSLDDVDAFIDRITNLTKNISTRLFGSLAEAPTVKPELPAGELYITPVRLGDIQVGLREIEVILDDTYNKL